MANDKIREAEEKLRHAQRDILEAEEALRQADAARAEPAAREPAPEPAPVASQPTAPAQATPKPQPAPEGKWRVEFERENCIGAGACVAANADFWSIDEDGKATLKSAVYDQAKQRWVLYLDDEKQLQKQRDAAGVCPVNVIHIIGPDGHQEI